MTLEFPHVSSLAPQYEMYRSNGDQQRTETQRLDEEPASGGGRSSDQVSTVVYIVRCLRQRIWPVAKIRLGRDKIRMINRLYSVQAGWSGMPSDPNLSCKRGPQRTTSTSYQDDLVTERSEFRVPPFDLPSQLLEMIQTFAIRTR